jgi:hypothetical protein
MSDGDFIVPQSWPARIRLASALCASGPTHTQDSGDYCLDCLLHADLLLERPDYVAAIVGAVLEPSMAWKGLFIFDPQDGRWMLSRHVTMQELEDRLRNYLAWEVSTMEEFCKDDVEALVPRQAVIDLLQHKRTSATPVTTSVPTCICGPDHTGEDNVNPACPVHGAF